MKSVYLRPALFCGLVMLSACAPMQTDDSPTLEERIAQQDQQLRQMQPQQADTWREVQAMRQELDDLKGQLSNMQNGAPAAAVQPGAESAPGASAAPLSGQTLSPANAAPLSGQTYTPAPQIGISQNGIAAQPLPSQGLPQRHAPDSSAYGAAGTALTTPATGSYGLPPDPTPALAASPAASGIMAQSTPAAAGASTASPTPTQVLAPSDSTWGKADPKPVLATPKKDLSLALFDAGVNSYNARKYDDAARSFNDFLKNYKNHTQTAEAQYYLADCDFQRNRFPEAVLAYENVIKKYPKSSVAPKAYLKQAISFGKMNQKAAAKVRMQELIKKFPNSAEATRARTYLKTNK